MTSQHNTPPDLLGDFRKILALFDKEIQIYKQQISILRSSIDELQNNDANRINMISLSELRAIINNIDQQTLKEVASINSDGNNISETKEPSSLIQATSAKNHDINDYLCQICLDTPKDCLLEPCMHFCLCVRCVKLLTEPKCPICRRQIDFYQNVFS
jgi:hypothetical protein